MELLRSSCFLFLLLLFLIHVLYLGSASSSSSSSRVVQNWAVDTRSYTGISGFRTVNRRRLRECLNPSPDLQINVSSSSSSKLSDEEFVNVTVSGVLVPSPSDWIAMITPSNSNVDDCPLNEVLYAQTGDLSSLPLLCHYPVKAAFLTKDPDYLSCKKKACNQGGICSCSASLNFHVINIRTDIQFVLFGSGFDDPCLFLKSDTYSFQNPNAPLYAHLSSLDSTGSSMRLSWVSGDKEPQQVEYGDGRRQNSLVSTFTQDDMCSSTLPSPAKDFGWHDPGFIHTAVMTDLQPSTAFSYKYGSDSVGWSDEMQMRTPPAGGADEVHFLAFGDMGKAPLDSSVEHYIQPGSLSVIKAMSEDVDSGAVDAIFHIGDISYATGFLVEWDFFLKLINPLASKVSYMTAIGNHERDYVSSGSVYETPDSGGECGVAYETYFQMPTLGKDKPWYSIEMATVHFTVISTEHDWSENSEQSEWMKKDMASVDRSKTPWLIFAGHRPMYSSSGGLLTVDGSFVEAVEPVMLDSKVDLGLFGHVHNYERTCSVYKETCKAMPTKDENGVDTYDNTNYTAPVHAVIGMAGFTLDTFKDSVESWSLSRISAFGYVRVHATRQELNLEFVNADTGKIEDSFRIIK